MSVLRYTIRIEGKQPKPYSMPGFALLIDRLLREAEENISDLLPEGYYCKIEEA